MRQSELEKEKENFLNEVNKIFKQFNIFVSRHQKQTKNAQWKKRNNTLYFHIFNFNNYRTIIKII